MLIIQITNVKKQYLKPFHYVQIELLGFDSNTWNHFTVCKQMSSCSLKKLCTNYSLKNYIQYVYEQDLALNNPQWLICHKTQLNHSSLGVWAMWSIPSLPLLSVPLWPWVVAPAKVPSMSQIELFNLLQGINMKQNY